LRAKIVQILVLIAIVGCSKNQEVEEREAYWKAEAEQFFQSPRDMVDLHSWLREKQVYYTFDHNEIADGQWVKWVETIYVDGIVCESWSIRLSVTVNDNGNILAHKVDKAGRCL
jgi:hypothetical protein